MKVLLYFENESLIQTSGIGRAFQHQKEALTLAGVDFTVDPFDESYDILHINTVGPTSEPMIKKAHAQGKKVIYHAHSTEEDFRNSFILSNQIAPLWGKYISNLYEQADLIITPTDYSKSLLESYGTITKPILSISNGIDLSQYAEDEEKNKAFRKYCSLKDTDQTVLSVGLYFERKGILDFVEVAQAFPKTKFIWFGYSNPVLIPKNIRDIIENHPMNVFFPGYVKGPIIQGAYRCADVFWFPSYEETEGIVVLEALASQAQVLVRDIGVYDGWLEDQKNCYMASDNPGFIQRLKGLLEGQLPSTRLAGYQTAETRSLAHIGEELKQAYEKVLSL